MNEPLLITIQTFGARSHATGNDQGFKARTLHQMECPHGPVIEHVKDGKPLTPLGRKLLEVRVTYP